MTKENLDNLRERLLRDEQVQQMIRTRAYEIYELRGGQPGREAQDWLRAEREVIAFLIARESSRAEEKESESAGASPAKRRRSRDTSKAGRSEDTEPKKPSTRRSTSKRTEAPKTKTRRKSKPSGAEEG